MLIRKPTATMLAAAVLAGAVSGGAVAAFADGGSATTTTVAAPAATGVTTSAGGADAATVYRRAAGSVVQIGAGESTGTGFVVDSEGLIVTNEHVVDGANGLTVTLQDGSELRATLVGKDASSDLALLRVDPGSHDLAALTLSDDADLAVGDTAYAIGSPYGLEGTLTTGVISALHRQITAPNGFSISDAIQTDAELNPGNSGGPLLNAAGEVIGVNAQVYGASQTAGGQTSGGTGLGFAIPSSTVKRVVDALREGTGVRHAYLGVAIEDATGGARLGAVTPGGPADEAGLQAGDVITRLGSAKIADGDDLAAAVSKLQPGEEVAVEVTRDGASRDVQVTLGTQPAEAKS
jgi:putative serine protease PepD